MTDAAIDEAGAIAAGNALSPLLITLLKGVIYRDDASAGKAGQWQDLLALQHRVREYVAVLGLTLVLDEAEGYAFLRSLDRGEQDVDNPIPRLIARRPLSYPVSLLLALLRKKLAEFDAGIQEGGVRLVLSREDIGDLLRLFLPDTGNEARLMDRLESDINKVVELGFLRRMKSAPGEPAVFEVRRIIKSFVDAQWLAEFDARLAEYRGHLQADEAGGAAGDADE